MSNTGLAHMAYFFFDFKDEKKQDARALLVSLLSQLSNQSDSFCDILHHRYLTHQSGSLQPQENALTACLKDMVKISENIPIYLIVDALDECPDTPGIPSPRDEVLDLIKELVELNLPHLRLCVTSRHEFDIRRSLEPLTTTSTDHSTTTTTPTRISLHDERGQKDDIKKYISSIIHSDNYAVGWKDKDKTLVVETLSNKADGM